MAIRAQSLLLVLSGGGASSTGAAVAAAAVLLVLVESTLDANWAAEDTPFSKMDPPANPAVARTSAVIATSRIFFTVAPS
jgi:hypothetical protein